MSERRAVWAFIEPHRVTCQRYHTQTVERLAERGGLSPKEMLAVIDEPSSYERRTEIYAMSLEEAVPMLNEALAKWARAPK
jgi:hypothetical protein